MRSAELKVCTGDRDHAVLRLHLSLSNFSPHPAKNLTSHRLPPVFGFWYCLGETSLCKITGQPRTEAQASLFSALSRNQDAA
jgi:hypothetical protein